MITTIGIVALAALCFAAWMRFEQSRAIELPEHDFAEDEWVENCREWCDAKDAPCESCLAGGFCEGRFE